MKFARLFFFPSFLTVFFAAAPDFGGGMAPEHIKLPQPMFTGDTSVEKALQERHSLRDYPRIPLELSEISQLLWAAQGITGFGGRRTAPSAGATYPLEVRVVVGNVNGLSAGIYAYSPHKHELKKIEKGDKRLPLSNACLDQKAVKNAAASIVISAVYQRTMIKYGERGFRYVNMEAGHAAQNVCLQAVSLGLATVVIGAFHDEMVKAILNLPEKEEPLYVIPVGRR
ncbi:MAG: Nitroreductase family protein [Syntrophus sp. PtaB.Bin001]|nr:MAG: Nitroreductase family protein [Syntrophus sp. PtaB.Bin001]